MNPSSAQVLPQAAEYVRVLPEIVLAIFGIIIMLLDPLLDERLQSPNSRVARSCWRIRSDRRHSLPVAISGYCFLERRPSRRFQRVLSFLVTTVTTVVILSSYEYMEVQHMRAGEYYALILFGAVGMCLMSSAVELVLIFIALEISSISTYILAGFRHRAAISSESSLKYFLLGSFATAFFLYGVALMFGATGSTNIAAIGEVLSSDRYLCWHTPALHSCSWDRVLKWQPRPFTYGLPTCTKARPRLWSDFMSTAPKAAVFAVLLRIMFEAQRSWPLWLIWVVAALSMTLGNIGALVQQNVKRLLAYSSIAHAGYLLVAYAALPGNGIPAAMFYTASYAAMNVGAFAVVSHFANAGERYVTLEDYAGLGRRSPVLAATLTIFLLSLIGIPITGGFFAKFYVFSAALQANLVGLTIIGVLNSAVGAYYYLRIIVMMYMRGPREETPMPPIPFALGTALAISVFATIYLGVLPGRVLEYARTAVDLLR